MIGCVRPYAGYEPPSGWNLPPGCFESDPDAPWSQKEPKICGDCSHLLASSDGLFVCELEFEDAFDKAEKKGCCDTPWTAADWACGWVMSTPSKGLHDTGCDQWIAG